MGLEQKLGDMGIVTVSLEKAVGWARSNAVWPGVLRDRDDEHAGSAL